MIPPPPKSLKCDHGLRRQAIVESLLSDIFHGKLRPGQHLVTQSLADRFGVSHTPIREALIALAGMGVVDLLPNRGATIRRVTPKDVSDICQVRRALECEAVRSACGRIDPSTLNDLHADLRRLISLKAPSGPRFIEKSRDVDSRLHDEIVGSCDNGFLANELCRLKILFRAFRDASWEHDQARNEYGRLVQEAHEHLAIVEALRAGNRREAVLAMSRHIMSGSTYWTRALPGSAEPEPRKNRHTSVNGNGEHR